MRRRVLVTLASFAILACVQGTSRALQPAIQRGAGTFEPAATPPDPALLRLVLTLEPGTRVLGAVAADIDHDGDLDVVATDSDNDLTVWLNEGDHFRRQRSAPPATVATSADFLVATAGSGLPGALPRSLASKAHLIKCALLVPGRSEHHVVAYVSTVALPYLPGSRFGRAPPDLSVAA